ncbi:Ig-like domain repeat protein [Methanobrevibacter sp. DSM 116169]|uniref:Ig-like domain repeat protein n=1 Tax=Methanobrevibacter sp. DSM 116169 TaxID=3242727 RepID=UPI0038FC1991
MKIKNFNRIFSLTLIILILFLSFNVINAEDGNFTTLDNKINSDSNIILDSNYKLANAEFNQYENGIVINSTKTIDGNGSYIDGINAEKQVRIFNIGSDGNLTLKNLILKNSYNEVGGAINVAKGGALTLINVSFINSSASNGGAIYSNSSTIIIIDSNFLNNFISNKTSSESFNGAGIYISNSNLTITNTNFLNNNASIFLKIDEENFNSSSGGGIYSLNSKIEINNSTFYKNYATQYGGAIAVFNGTLKINKTNFTGNYLKYFNIEEGQFMPSGGSISLFYSNLTVYASNFENSIANAGGVIFKFNSDLKVYMSNFTNNGAYNQGGVLWDQTSKPNSGETLIDNCIFKNSYLNSNNMDDAGVVIISSGVEPEISKINIFNSNFSNNIAKNELMGLIQLSFSELNIDNSNFLNNTAVIIKGFSGNNPFKININNSNFTNTVSQYVIFTIRNSEAMIKNSNFINNTFSLSAIFNFAGNHVISGCLFENNNVKSIENIYASTIVNTGEMKISNSNFYNNNASYGGAILNGYCVYDYANDIFDFYDGGNLIIDTVIFKNNHATYGGAIFNPGNYTILDPEEVNIDGGKLYITNSVFENNNAEYGGAIASMKYDFNHVNATYNPINIVNITNSEFIGNLASNIGGAIYNNATMYLKNNIMENCLAEELENYIYNDNIIINPTVTFINGDTIYTTVNSKITINVTVTDDNKNPITGKFVNMAIGEKQNIIVEIIEGKGFYEYSVTTIGNFTVTGIYNGGGNESNIRNGKIISFKESKLLIDAKNVIEGSNVTITIYLTDFEDNKLNAIVQVLFNDTILNINVINGIASFIIPDLPNGKYNISAYYGGNSEYASSNYSTSFKVSEFLDTIIKVNDLEMYYKNGSKYVITLFDSNFEVLSEMNVYIKINGISYMKITDKNGNAELNINLRPGKYEVSVYFNGTGKYAESENNSNVNVLSTIIIENITKHYKNDTQYKITVVDGNNNSVAGKNVSININGVIYYRLTDKDGIATLNINLDPGKYVATVEHPESDLKISSIIEVIPILYGKNLIKNFGNSEQYEVAVLDNLGKPLSDVIVRININGVIYSRISDSNGIAKLNINLNPGSYIATAMYNGYSTSNNITVNP